MKAVTLTFCSVLVPTTTCLQDRLLPSWQSVLSDCHHDAALQLKSWTLHSDDYYANIPAVVPGDLWSDLMRAQLIDEPYYDRNFLTQRAVWAGHNNNGTLDPHTHTTQRTRTWTYRTVMDTAQFNNTLLVVEGIKMGARLAWNGIPLGTVTDQFLRYIFPLPHHNNNSQLDHNNNELSVTFDPHLNTDGRFMGCSGGWDWAPYSRVGDGDRGSRVGTLGLVAPVYVVPVHEVYIDAVVCRVYYMGNYPTKPLSGPVDDFVVQVQVHIARPWQQIEQQNNDVLVKSDFTNRTYRLHVARNRMDQVLKINLHASNVKLWWPNGLGDQPLYKVQVSLVSENSSDDANLWIQKRVGFRIVALVTSNDTKLPHETEKMLRSAGSGRLGMFFRINGAVVYSRGANMIPMDLLEGRWSDQRHRTLVQSAAAAHMNMLRVWGGGAVLPQSFYDACDEEGIMLYHDLMFVGEQNHSAVHTDTVREEIRHIIRKLSAHPSIVLWSGCNECTYGGGDMEVYESLVMTTVAEEDDTRAIWPSSPSDYGWERGVDTLYGRPNGDTLKIRKKSTQLLEMHGPYHHGYSASYPGVNSLLTPNTYTTNLPPRFKEAAVGIDFPNMFISEFGSSVTSSFESMSSMLPEKSWSLHGGELPDTCHQLEGIVNECNGTNPMAERCVPSRHVSNRSDVLYRSKQ